MHSPLAPWNHPAAAAAGVRLYVKRDDLLTPAPGTALQGNKVRKLGGILTAALEQREPPVLASFGGAYSNHLSALATAGRLFSIPIVLYVRGEEADNAVLTRARADGAHLIPLSRTEYRMKGQAEWLAARSSDLAQAYQRPAEQIWWLPEGGTTAESALQTGALYPEIVNDLHGQVPDFLCLSAGTGGTAAGVIAAAQPPTRIEVFPALKGDWMSASIRALLPNPDQGNWSLITDYHFGGYGKFPEAWRMASPGIATRAALPEPGLPPLEPIYTAKLFFGVLDRLRRRVYPAGSTVVIIHSGGIY
ncbi:pyridoxal-phosphate dependent enzyme [Neolewinella lacunae]|uniref:Pyridoxal-phosphate dependent enzyme n=1 Tax=Neolewinella lacunae TaxID=1517758 RepID=A0A923PRG1_9BACT|nr:pyridoxal-phosphate dependent enzyme [Neolewinella lacunae]MBC6996108.1 pyridoxal-phosphate dependent enzyme [Neolewinella lacunae]MDN3633962.1 pyridoxal-phosphate dependent enzyme [Neolewinella lacunae]